MIPIRSSLLVALLACPAVAQCAVQGAAATVYGRGCAPLFTAPTVTVSFDATSCALDVAVQAPGGCCNTFLSSHALVLGATQGNLPLPQIGAGCALLVTQSVLLLQPAQLGGTFRLNVPPLLLPFSFFAQAGAVYFTTIGFTDDLTLSAGYVITLS